MTEITRCFWVNLKNAEYVRYHDEEWGKPLHDDEKLFELLILEGAQAGLSWETILKKRNNYRKRFFNFDIKKCSKLKKTYLDSLLKDEGLIRNRAKIYSVPINAQGVIEIQKEFGSFDHYLWSFINHRPLKNKILNAQDMPTETEISRKISADLKKRGFKFVGAKIMYAFMQASGMAQDHTRDCFYYRIKV